MDKVVTLTMNPSIDKSSSVATVAPEVKLRCESPSFHAGGGGINVSRAIAKLGGESTALYTAGGFTGDFLTQLLSAEEGIDEHAIPISGTTRESLTIFEESSTLQYRFGMPGPELSESEWQGAIDQTLALEGDYLVASGSLPPAVPIDFYAQLAEQAKAKQLRVVVDTSGNALQAIVGSEAYLLKPNFDELQKLVGTTLQGEDAVRDIARELIQQGIAEVVVVSMGAGGAAMVTADEFAHFRAPLVPIQSKVGAGDSMVGGIVLSLARGQSLVDSVKYGVASGTAAVMTPGTELCRLRDVEKLVPQVIVSA